MTTETAPLETSAERPVALTSKAVRMISLTREEEGIDAGWGLRVGVVGGGCSGFEYALDFENEARETDLIYDVEGLTIYVDPISSRYLKGTVVDYKMGMDGSGFKFTNPNASGTCGCGSSFAV